MNILMFIQVLLVIFAFFCFAVLRPTNSDDIRLIVLAQDIIKGVDLRGWSLDNAPSYFPDLFVYLFSSLLVWDWQIAFQISNVVILLLMPFAAVLLSKAHNSAFPRLLLVCFFSLFSLIMLEYMLSKEDVIVYQLLRCLHVGIVAFALICYSLFHYYMKNGNKLLLSLYVLIVILLSMSDLLFHFIYTLPMGLVCIYVVTISLINRDWFVLKRGLFVLFSTVGAALSGFFANSYILSEFLYYPPSGGIGKFMVSGRIKFDYEKIGQSFGRVMEVLHLWWDAYPVLCLIVVFALFSLVFHLMGMAHRKEHRSPVFILFLFALLCATTNILICIFSQRISGMGSFRYLSAFVFVPVIAHLVFWEVLNVWQYRSARVSVLLLSLCSMIISICMISTLMNKYNDHPVYRRPSLSKCVDNYKESYGLRNGLSQYWHAHMVTMYSKKGVVVNALTKDLKILYFLNNLKRYQDKYYNFIIIDPDHDKGKGCLRSSVVESKFGKPDDHFSCGGRVFYVYHNGQLQKWYNEIVYRQYPKLLAF